MLNHLSDYRNNILRLFDILSSFPFATSEKERYY